MDTVFTQGSPEDVFTCDIIRDVFGVESKVVPHPVSGKPMCIPLRAGLRAQLSVATG